MFNLYKQLKTVTLQRKNGIILLLNNQTFIVSKSLRLCCLNCNTATARCELDSGERLQNIKNFITIYCHLELHLHFRFEVFLQ